MLVTSYGYDALGRRYKFTSYDGSDPNDPNTSETTYYYYDTRYQVLAEKTGTPDATTSARYVYGNTIDVRYRTFLCVTLRGYEAKVPFDGFEIYLPLSIGSSIVI